jgi:hypothetical protein
MLKALREHSCVTDELDTFITFYFNLLIPDLRRHMSTIDNLHKAVNNRDVSTATEVLNQFIESQL